MAFPLKQAGAALGVLSQDPLDNPLAGVAGGMVGYYAASKLDLRTPVKPYSQITKSLKITGQSNVNYSAALIDKLNAFSKTYGEKSGDHVFAHRMDTRLANLNTMYHQKYGAPLFLAEETSIEARFASAISKLASVSSNSTQKALLSAFGSESLIHTVSTVPNAELPLGRRGIDRVMIDADTQIADKLAAIKSHITSQLGHGIGEDEANRIIKSLTPAIEGMPTMGIQLDDNLTFVDPTGKKFKFPIQYVDKSGARYGYSGNTQMASNSWNPFGSLYSHHQDAPESLRHLLPNGNIKPEADDVLRGFQPIEMLAGFDKDVDHSAQLNRLSSYSRTMFHNVGNFAANPHDPMAMQISALTNIDFTYVSNGRGGGTIEKISREAGAMGEASVFDKLMVQLGKHSSIGNPMSLNSNNDITSVSATKAIDPSIAADHSRRHATVTNRDFIMTDKHKEVIKKYTGLAYDGQNMAALSGFGNAREHTALLVDDQLSLAVSHIFGDKYTIDDGSGLFVDPNQFEEKKMVNLDFPNIGTHENPKYNISEDMLNALKQKGGVIVPSQVLGINNIGEITRLGREYTDATITAARTYKDYIRVSMEARYVPDDWVKIFSEVAKSGQTMFGKNVLRARTNAKRLSMMQQLKDAGVLTTTVKKSGGLEFRVKTADAEEIIINHTSGNLKTYKEIMNLTTRTYKKTFGNKEMQNATIILNRRDAGYKFVDAALQQTDKKTGARIASTLEDVKNAYMDQLFVENKAGRSAFINLIDKLELKKPSGYEDDLAFLHQYTQSGGYSKIADGGQDAKDAFKGRIRGIVDKLFTDITDFNHVAVLASNDLGPAIRGAGNEGAMSWLERMNLSMSGYTETDLASISTWNKDALHELNMISSSSSSGSDFNDVKLKYADVFSTVYEQSAEQRLAMLQPALNESKAKVSLGDNFISYRLTHSHMGYQSVPITLVETAHSRHISLDEEEVLSQLEKQRAKVIRADIELSRYQDGNTAGRKVRLDVFKEEVEALDSLVKRSMSGDNNIVKSALRGIVNDSEIQISRSIGGEFGAYATMLRGEGGRTKFGPIAAFNHNSIMKIAKGYGLDATDLEFGKQGSDFGRVYVKAKDGSRTPLSTLVTREPAQGPGSSLLVDVFYHKQLPQNDAFIGIPQIVDFNKQKAGKSVQALFAFGDFDSDTYKTASLGKGISFARMKELHEKQRMALNNLEDLAEFANAIALKGSAKDLVRVEDLAKYETNATQASAKAIQRKMIAPEATEVATKMAEALDMHLSGLRGTVSPEVFAKRQFGARMAIHNLVENLLKTQHGKSSDVGVASLPMQRLSQQLGSVGKNDQFRNIASQILDESLGFNMGKDGSASASARAMYHQAKTDILDALDSFGSVVNASQGSLKANRESLYKGIQDFTKSVNALATNGMLPGVTSSAPEAKMQNMVNKAKNVVEYAKQTAANNKKTLGIAGVALGAIAMTMGAESTDLSKDSLPLKTSDAILPPLPTEKGYITKGRDYRKQQSTTVKGSASQPVNKSSIDRNVFSGNPSANIKISDKRNTDIRNLQ